MARDSILQSSRHEEVRPWDIGISSEVLVKEEDFETAMQSPPFIFKLPDSIRTANPDAFIPSRISLGPYHHFQPELYKMKLYRLHVAKKAREEFQLPDFHKLHHQLLLLELRIRGCYDTHLEIGGDTLAWIMLMDALFLLRLLLDVSTHMKKSPTLMLPLPNFDDQNYLSDSLDQKLVSQFQILTDVLKLENQIPILVFKSILPENLITLEFPQFLFQFCRSLSPVYVPLLRGGENDYPKIMLPIIDESNNLLHLMYLSILMIPIYLRQAAVLGVEICPPLTFLQKCLRILGSILNIAIIQQLNQAIALIQELVELLHEIIDTSKSSNSSTPAIPSASQLKKVGVKFEPSIRGILNIVLHINQNLGAVTLFLPVVTVNAFTETLLENLVAFEAMTNLDPPVLARYLELMKALMPTSKDMKILKDAEILCSHLESDEEVVKLFSRVGNSIATLNNKPDLEKLAHLRRPSEGSTSEQLQEEIAVETNKNYESCQKVKVKICVKIGIFEQIKNIYEEQLQEEIVGEINQYYESCKRVKVKRFVTKSVCCILKIVAFLVVVFLIFLVVAGLVRSVLKLFKSPDFEAGLGPKDV